MTTTIMSHNIIAFQQQLPRHWQIFVTKHEICVFRTYQHNILYSISISHNFLLPYQVTLKFSHGNRICLLICTWRPSLHPPLVEREKRLHMDPWNEIFISNGPHPRPSILLDLFKIYTLKVLYLPQKADDMGGVPQMVPSKQIKYSGLLSGSSISKWPSEMSVEKYPGND